MAMSTTHDIAADDPVTQAHGLTATVADSFADVRDAYMRLAAQSSAPAPQSPEWIGVYEKEHGGRFAFVTVAEDGQPRMILALEHARRNGVTVLRFAGGRHANANFPAIDPSWLPDPDILHPALAKAVHAACPGVDALVFERQLARHGGLVNPLVSNASTLSPNLSLAADISGGFDGLLAEISGKRKRKKNRSQARKFEAAGGYVLARVTSEAEVDRAFDAFFAMKNARFRAAGIENVFATPHIQAFLRALFKGELDKREPRFVIDTLDVTGKLRAVAANSVSGTRTTCEFASIADDDMAFASPGEFLFFHAIRQAAEQGFTVYDFGVGDERYKRLWCKLETAHHDTVIALTAKGQAWRAGWLALAALKRRVKNDKVLWPMVKRLRQRLRGAQTDSGADQDDD